MQTSGPEAFDVDGEDDRTLDAYAIRRGENTGFGWQCLVARRLAERGVRFIELIDTGSRPNWDSHGDMNEHVPLAKAVDQPIAALIKESEAARHAGRNTHRVGHRIRPHSPQRG